MSVPDYLSINGDYIEFEGYRVAKLIRPEDSGSNPVPPSIFAKFEDFVSRWSRKPRDNG